MEGSLTSGRLRVFHAVVTKGGVTRAARFLHLSQPAVSSRMRELEKQIGTVLLERGGRRFALTDAGRVLAKYAARMFELESEATRAIEDLRDVRAGRLAVGASETPGHYLLLDALGRFRSRFPAVRLAIDIANSATICNRVADGALELGFIEGDAVPPTLERTRFHDDRLCLLIRHDDPLAKKRHVRAADLAERHFILRDEGSAVRTTVDTALARAGIEPSVALEFATTEAVKRAVVAGLGISFVPESSVAVELPHGTLTTKDVEDVRMERRLWMIHDPRKRPSAAAKAFLQSLGTVTG